MNAITKKSSKTLTKSLVAASVIAVIATPVSAAKNRHNSNIEYARVVGVTPVYEQYQINNPVEECWNERVQNNRRTSQSRSRTPEILGGLIGAAIGHQFGKGRGQDVATAAGVVLGASVGRDIKHRHKRNSHHDSRYNSRYNNDRHYQVVQRCEVRDSYSTQDRIVGYDVAYQYNGNVFYTQMDQHPGKRIKVHVTVNPV